MPEPTTAPDLYTITKSTSRTARAVLCACHVCGEIFRYVSEGFGVSCYIAIDGTGYPAMICDRHPRGLGALSYDAGYLMGLKPSRIVVQDYMGRLSIWWKAGDTWQKWQARKPEAFPGGLGEAEQAAMLLDFFGPCERIDVKGQRVPHRSGLDSLFDTPAA